MKERVPAIPKKISTNVCRWRVFLCTRFRATLNDADLLHNIKIGIRLALVTDGGVGAVSRIDARLGR